MAEPILKWAGGKRQIRYEILSHFPEDYRKRRYHEPMVGAGAIVFGVEPKQGTINDINARLMRMYEVVRDSPEELITRNSKHSYRKKYYYQARAHFNSSKLGTDFDAIDEASLMIFLNRTCWNGLYRENRAGGFNVPMGKYHKPDFVVAQRIRDASAVLKKLRLYNENFDYIKREAKKGDIVYFDPPYHPASASSVFTSYHREGFDLNQQKSLIEVMVHLSENGVYVILSNSDASEIRKLYEEMGDSFHIERIRARRNINCRGDMRKKTGEIIVSNVPPQKRNTIFKDGFP